MYNIFTLGLWCVVFNSAGNCLTETEEQEVNFDEGCRKFIERQEALGVPSSDREAFREFLLETSSITVITGNEISAVTGVPVLDRKIKLRGKYNELLLQNVHLYEKNPSVVWEFFHKMREIILSKAPNKAHIAIANFEREFTKGGKKNFTLITQTVDSLHITAGSKNVHEMYGSVFKTQCTKCKDIIVTREYPVCEALRGKGSIEVNFTGTDIPEKELPHCKKMFCYGLLLPFTFLYPEQYPKPDLLALNAEFKSSKVIVLVGNAPVMFQTVAIGLALQDAVVAVFNDKPILSTSKTQFYFEGPITETIPAILKL